MISSPNDLSKVIHIDKFKIITVAMNKAGINIEETVDVTDEIVKLLEFYFDNRKIVEKIEEEKKNGKKRKK